jgi:hypothetical protein
MLPLKGIFTHELGLPGAEMLSSEELPHHRPAAQSYTTGQSPPARPPRYRHKGIILAQCFFSPSASLRNFLCGCVSSLSDLPGCLTNRVAVCRKCVQNILDEILLAPAGGLDGGRLLDSLGAAAAKEGNAAEHGAEDTDGELLYMIGQHMFQFFHAIVCDDARSVRYSISFCSSFPRRRVLVSGELTYVVRADLADDGECVVDGHICGWYV